MSLIRILYVDDEPDLREIAVLALELDPGFEVRSCSSGEEALAVFDAWKPDLVMLDVVMPGLDGPETLTRLRMRPDGQVPVIFITARAQAVEAERLMALGAAGVIAKPFDPMTLARAVRDRLAR